MSLDRPRNKVIRHFKRTKHTSFQVLYKAVYSMHLCVDYDTARCRARTPLDVLTLLFEMLLVLLGGPVFIRKAYRQKDYTSRKVKTIGIAASGTSTGLSERPPLE